MENADQSLTDKRCKVPDVGQVHEAAAGGAFTAFAEDDFESLQRTPHHPLGDPCQLLDATLRELSPPSDIQNNQSPPTHPQFKPQPAATYDLLIQEPRSDTQAHKRGDTGHGWR
jgi:hypothetical protein